MFPSDMAIETLFYDSPETSLEPIYQYRIMFAKDSV